MRRTLTYGLLAAVVLATAAASFFLLTAPAPALALGGAPPDGVVFGAYHVHSSRSDGSGSVEDIARAAAEAGRAFVIFTDHGDASTPLAPPRYVSGVLCIDAVEVNTAQGHVVALGLDRSAPYPLAGESRDVIDDIHRLGGLAIAAHPDSPTAAVRWRGAAPYDGLEWINADAEWRDNSPRELLAAGVRSIVRGPESIVSLFSRPAFTLQRWDAALRLRRVVAVAALDAHARFGLGDTDEPHGRTLARWPSYSTMFRTMTQAVILDAPLSGDAGRDAGTIVDALAAGRTFSLVTALGAPGSLEFAAEQGPVRAWSGGVLEPFDSAADTHIRAAVPQAPGARVVLMRSGQTVAEGRGAVSVSRVLAPGAYRVEAYLPTSDVPWIVSNPIYLGTTVDEPPAAAAPATPLHPLSVDADWNVERDDRSTALITREPPVLKFDFALGTGAPAGQYSAMSVRVDGDAAVDRLEFTARASRPMRVSVQIRLPGAEGQRWRRSVYLDETPRTMSINVADMDSVNGQRALRPVAARLHSVLFVVDTLNTSPGTSGTVWVRDVQYGAAAAGEATSGR